MQGGSQFDRNICTQLYSRITNGTQFVTPNEFAEVWVAAEQKLLEKIPAHQANLDKVEVD